MVCVFKCTQADYWWGQRVTKFSIKGNKLFGNKILNIRQPTNKKKKTFFPYFLSEAIMNRHEIEIEDLSQGGRRGLI